MTAGASSSIRRGALRAGELWRVVTAVWLIGAAVHLPALTAIRSIVAAATSDLPNGELPAGELILLIGPPLWRCAVPLTVIALTGVGATWLWTLVWHGGLVGWTLWSGARPARVGEIVGLGALALPRYLALSLIAAAVWLGVAIAPWLPIAIAATAANERASETQALALIAGGFVWSVAATVACWAATLRALWLLGEPRAPWPPSAFLGGVAATWRAPVATVATVAVWVVPGLALVLLPVAAGLLLDTLRGGWMGQLLLHASSWGRSFCWVALLMSFAPTTGAVASVAGEARDGSMTSARRTVRNLQASPGEGSSPTAP